MTTLVKLSDIDFLSVDGTCEHRHGEGYFQDWPDWLVRP